MFFDDAKKHAPGIVSMALGKGKDELPSAPPAMEPHHAIAREALDAMKADDHEGFAEAMSAFWQDMNLRDKGTEEQNTQY